MSRDDALQLFLVRLAQDAAEFEQQVGALAVLGRVEAVDQFRQLRLRLQKRGV